MRVRGQLDLAGVAESGRGPSRVRFMVDGTISGRSAVTVDRVFDINICSDSAAVSYTRLLVYYCCWSFSHPPGLCPYPPFCFGFERSA